MECETTLAQIMHDSKGRFTSSEMDQIPSPDAPYLRAKFYFHEPLGKYICSLLDTGASRSVIKTAAVRKLPGWQQTPMPPAMTRIATADESGYSKVRATVLLNLALEAEDRRTYTIQHTFLVVDNLRENAIIGYDLAYGRRLVYHSPTTLALQERNTRRFEPALPRGDKIFGIPIYRISSQTIFPTVIIDQSTVLPIGMTLTVKATMRPNSFKKGLFLMENLTDLGYHVVSGTMKVDKSGKVKIKLLNNTNRELVLKQSKIIATARPADDPQLRMTTINMNKHISDMAKDLTNVHTSEYDKQGE